MTFSIFSAVVPTIAYATISLYAIYMPMPTIQATEVNHVVLMEDVKLTVTPVPTSTPIPVQAIATQVASHVVETPVSTNATAVPATTVLNDAQIQFLGNCESGMRPETNTGNGYYGAFQFSYGTWQSMGTGYERADLAPLEVQKDAVQRLLSRSSIFTQFPGCARKMRSLGLI